MQKDPEEVAGMFDATAKRYDLLNTLLSGGNDRLWRIHMQRAVRPQPGERILDVAAGTGASAAPMAKAGALVTALDISQGMLEEGRKRHADIEFVHGDASELPFDGDSFDAVTISFGLRNVQHPRAALSEFLRVLKPGGRVVICEFSQPPVNVVRKGYELYLGTVLPGMAKAGALVTALDISHGMLEEGRKRHADIEFVHGSAEELPFDGDSFDAVTISFGLRNVQHPRAALSEFMRVLKPGGRVVICEFSQPPVNVVRKGYELYLGTVLPGMAKAASSNPEAYRYLVESINSWPDQQVLSQWIRTAGFTRVAHRNLTMGVVALHRGRKPTEQTGAMRIARHAHAEEQGS